MTIITVLLNFIAKLPVRITFAHMDAAFVVSVSRMHEISVGEWG